jgi:hypothetical protein
MVYIRLLSFGEVMGLAFALGFFIQSRRLVPTERTLNKFLPHGINKKKKEG